MALFVLSANAGPVQLFSVRNPFVSLLTGGDDNSLAPSLSPDGRFIVFISTANDLAPGGNSFYCPNVFLRDCASNTTVLVSGNLSGTGGGNGSSILGQASTNGQFVVFQSDASNLVPNDTNGVTDIFVRDLVAGTTTLVSVSTNGGPANGASTDPVMTPDGRYVAFISRASNLVPGDTNGIPDVFVRDLVAGTNDLVSVGALCSALVSPGAIMATPVITPDGRYVAFFSLATNLVSAVPGTTTGEVYVRDRLAGTMTWASTNAAAIVSAMLNQTNATSYHPQLSDDGRYVAFKTGTMTSSGTAAVLQYDSTTGATAVVNTNEVGGSVDVEVSYGPEMTPDGRFIAFVEHEGSANSGYSSVHVWDVQLASDTLVSDDGSGVPANTASHTPNISPDGRFVAFLSNATNLVGNTLANGFHVYLRDLQSNTTELVDVDTNGVGSTDETLTTLSLSADGRYVAFGSPDGSLVGSDNNHAEDVFVRDLVAGATEMISQRDATVVPQAADGFTMMSPSSVSSDGRWLAFTSRADDLVPNDTNQALDVFVRDLVNGTNSLVSVGADGGPALGGNSENALISADGRYVVFISAATNLVTGPVNTNANVFRRDLQTGTTALVSVGTDGDASFPVISPDGRYVAFLSWATNLVVGMTSWSYPSGPNTYWRDMNLGQTVGLNGYNYAYGPSLSSDGRYVAYAYNTYYSSTSLHIWDTRLGKDIYTNANSYITSAAIDPTGTKILYRVTSYPPSIYVDNIATGTNLFSVQSTASIRNAACWSDDGSCLVFLSTNSPGSGSAGTNKVYLRDFQAGTLSLIGVAGPATGNWIEESDAPVISGDGRFVAYRSVATNATGFTAFANVCLFDRLTGSNTVLATEQAGSGPMVWVSRPVISDDGATIAFLDACADLVNGDLNRAPDALGTFLDAALIDSDGDGIPDWWMMKYFGHPTGQAYDHSLASDDADGDGESNLQEYFAGTDPTDPNSVFRLWASAPVTNMMTLTWFAVPGRTYQVLYTTNLDDPAWLTVTGNVWVTGNQGYYLAPVAQPQSFFRVFKSD
jgi:Tol biopolymer transport system component